MSGTIKLTQRKTYDLLEYFGAIGGFGKFLSVCATILVRSYGELNMKILVANKLYSWLSPQSGQREAIPKLNYLEIHFTFQRYILCCCRRKWFRKYESAIDQVENDRLKRFDLLTFSRRLSQYSAALNLTMKNGERQLAA